MCNNTEVNNEFDIKAWVSFLIKAEEAEPPWLLPTFMIAVCLISITSLVGNLLTCTVIYCDKTMHTATNFYLFNLAVSDLIITFIIFLGVMEAFEYGQWSCKVIIFVLLVLWNNSVLTITVLAVERYIAIWYPLQLKSFSIWGRVFKTIIAIWIIAMMAAMPEIWTIKVVKTNRTLICSIVPTPVAKIINGAMGILTFAVPLTIMIFVYIMIALKVNVTQKFNSGNNVFNQRDDRKRVNKLVMALTLSFIVCWLPYFTIRTLIFALEMYQLFALVKWWNVGQRLTVISSSFSLVLNPILFTLISSKFKISFKKLWESKIKGRRISIALV